MFCKNFKLQGGFIIGAHCTVYLIIFLVFKIIYLLIYTGKIDSYFYYYKILLFKQ